MSVAAAQAYLNLLIASQYDIELQVQFISQHKLFLQKAVDGFQNLKEDYEPGSKGDRALQARIAQLNEAEKMLDIKLNDLNAREKAITQLREQQTQMIGQNIQRSFRNAYMQGGGG